MAYGITAPAKRRGLFGKMFDPMAYSTGIGDGLKVEHTPQERIAQQPMAEEKKPGLGTRLFGRGWEDKAFALGGIMQGDPSGVYMMRQEKQREQQAAAEAAAAELKRAQELADWEYKKQYEWQNAPEPNNDTVRDFEWYQGLSEEEKRLYHQMKPQMQIGPDGRPYYINPYGSAAPSAPVGKLTPIQEGAASNGGATF